MGTLRAERAARSPPELAFRSAKTARRLRCRYRGDVRRAALPFTSIRAASSYQDRALLRAAWALPVAQKYDPLQSQTWKSICGPTSVCNVLRTVGVKTGPNPFDRFGVRAMSLDDVVVESSTLLPDAWGVEAVRLRDVDELRVHLRQSNDPSHRYISNFSRAPLFGSGGGHHSPIGGYLEAEDLVLVLDVNGGFGPWLVDAERLFDAMNTGDWSGGKTRGLAHFSRTR